MPARGSAPPRPPTETWTPSTILPFTLTLQPWSPTSAVWWLPQAGGTAGPADGERARCRPPSAKLAGERHRARLRVDQRQVAEVRAGARRRARARPRAGCRAASLSSGSCVQVAEPRVGDVRNEHVLRRREAQLAAAVRLGQPRQLEELIAGDPSHRRLEPHVVQPRLPLPEDADVIVRGARRGRRGRPGAAAGPGAPRAPCGTARLPTRRPGRRAATCCAPRAGPWSRKMSATAAQTSAASPGRTKASSGVAKTGPPEPCLPPTARLKPTTSSPSRLAIAGVIETSCVSRRRAVLGAAGDRHVELARQVGERLVADEDPLELARDRRGVDELLGREPGGRAADDAADVVHPRLQAS